MNNQKSVGYGIVGVISGALLVFVSLALAYYFNDTFHGVFVNNPNSVGAIMGEVAENSPQSVQQHREFVGMLVFGIFSGIICLQVLVFGSAMLVTRGILKSEGDSSVKLKRLDNAGIFFDLPLYTGLFGTVSSFMVIAFSRESSLLIAYSTTLLGIIFSVVLHVTVLYPAKRRLLNAVK
ncbi:MAG: hypothetical protein AB7F40_02025 [Victivallaceae bacterium]|nr:hypothetical protein [Victivallaceae bacterium]